MSDYKGIGPCNDCDKYEGCVGTCRKFREWRDSLNAKPSSAIKAKVKKVLIELFKDNTLVMKPDRESYTTPYLERIMKLHDNEVSMLKAKVAGLEGRIAGIKDAVGMVKGTLDK